MQTVAFGLVNERLTIEPLTVQGLVVKEEGRSSHELKTKIMKPHIHARSSSRKFGGKEEDYMDIHQFLDSSKAHIADVRHRALFHNSFGCFIVEQVFGITRENSDGKTYSTRDVAEQHIIEDLGRIPSVQDYFQHMELQNWMGGPVKRKRTMSFDEVGEAEANHNDRLED